MSVTLTDLGFKLRPVRKTVPINGIPIEIESEFTFAAQGVGDASAGSIYCPVDFGSLISSKYYYFITSIHVYFTASGDMYLATHSDRWENLYFAGHANEVIALWTAAGDYRSFDHRDQLNKMIYLGKPRKADADFGQCDFTWETNTDTKEYNLTIRGFFCKGDKDPLPISQLYQ